MKQTRTKQKKKYFSTFGEYGSHFKQFGYNFPELRNTLKMIISNYIDQNLRIMDGSDLEDDHYQKVINFAEHMKLHWDCYARRFVSKSKFYQAKQLQPFAEYYKGNTMNKQAIARFIYDYLRSNKKKLFDSFDDRIVARWDDQFSFEPTFQAFHVYFETEEAYLQFTHVEYMNEPYHKLKDSKDATERLVKSGVWDVMLETILHHADRDTDIMASHNLLDNDGYCDYSRYEFTAHNSIQQSGHRGNTVCKLLLYKNTDSSD